MAYLLNCLVAVAFHVAAVVNGQEVPTLTGSTNSPIYNEDNMTISCSYTYDSSDIGTRLMIGRNEGDIWGTYIVESGSSSFRNDARTTIQNVGNDRLEMTIQGPACSDQGEYVCGYQRLEGGKAKDYYHSVNLDIRVRPQAPAMTWVTPAQATTSLEKRSSLSVKCTATTGKSGEGSIAWRIYRGADSSTELTNGDPEVDPGVDETVPGQTCMETKSNTLTVSNLGKADQDLRVACFVKNTDFSPTVPTNCEDSNTLCQRTETIKILYGVESVNINPSTQSTEIYEGDTLTLTCEADGVPQASYTWSYLEDENRTLDAVPDSGTSRLILNDLDIDGDSGVYNCTATNEISGTEHTMSTSFRVTVVVRPTTPTTTPTPPTTAPEGSTQPVAGGGSSGDDETVIIVVVVIIAVLVLVAVIILVYCIKKRRQHKEIEEPPEKPYNNRSNLAFQNSQPDLVADDKKFNNPSLNNSFDPKNEDGLMYADLTYDNRPRSRKPMAIGDTASDYSDVTMPQV